jgi:hypothetical protein
LRWIAITDQGIVAYNRIGNYTVGRFFDRVIDPTNKSSNRRSVEPPDLEATVESQTWIADKATFAEGRRFSLGEVGETASIEELVPDWLGEAA